MILAKGILVDRYVAETLKRYMKQAFSNDPYRPQLSKWLGATAIIHGEDKPAQPFVDILSITKNDMVGRGTFPSWRWCNGLRFLEQNWKVMLDMRVNDFNGANRGPGNDPTSGDVLNQILTDLFATPEGLANLSALGLHNVRFRDDRQAMLGSDFENGYSLMLDTGVYLDTQ